jgi:hypothetical protein
MLHSKVQYIILIWKYAIYFSREVPKPKEKKSDPNSEEPSPKKSKVDGHETVTVKKVGICGRISNRSYYTSVSFFPL